MSANQPRLELRIDVFALGGQRALVLPTLTPPELVTAILDEFNELEFLSDAAGNYQLLKAPDRAPLDDATPTGQQLTVGEHLLLVEREPPLPKGAKRMRHHVYLRDQGTSKVYKLHWQPAIIGRPDNSQEHNDWLAVNMATHPAGRRISRRHAQITEANGQYFVERLSPNPTVVKDSQGISTPVDQQKHPLHHGDVLYFENSQIALKFIVREREPAS
jgi:FHA domain